MKRQSWAAIVAAAFLGSVFLACAENVIDDSGETLDAGPPDARVADTGADRTTPPVDAGTDQDLPPEPDAGDAGEGGNVQDASDAGVDAPVDAPTCAKVAPSNVCGLAPQCGCAVNNTCEVTGDNGETKCSQAGTAAMGTGCASTATCKEGLACVDGVCRPYCATLGTACTAPGTNDCRPHVTTDDGGTRPNDKVCQVTCDPVDTAACASSTTATCIIYDDNTTDCVGAGAVAVGGNCDTNLCARGLVCVGVSASSAHTCHKWCRVGHAPSDCPGSATCTGFSPKAIVNGVEYGSCN